MRQFHVVYNDGTSQDVTVKPFDYVAAERHFAKSMVTIGQQPYGEHAYFLAWSAERRRDGTLPDFDDWLLLIDSVAQSEAVDPTVPPKGPSTSKRRRTTGVSPASS